MTYQAALAYLHSFLNFERLPFEYQRQFNLKRMNSLLDWFGHPEHSFSSVLIAGTKGKGSTANFLASMLAANGYRVGLYTSPHLIDPRERIRINGRAISKNDFGKIIGQICPTLERRKKEISDLEPITYFEIFTLAAMLYCASRRVDFGIFEVGMGGRLDATNVLKPLVSIITPLSFDHEEHLGRTLSLITREKAAIIKRNGCVVSGGQRPEAMRIVRNAIRKQRAKGYFYGSTFKTERERLSLAGGRFDFRFGPRVLKNVRIKLLGRFQTQNAALALACAGILENHYGFPFKEIKLREGLLKAFWPGRFEVVKRNAKTYILDGAHNGASMYEARLALDRLFPGKEITAVLGVSREKRLISILEPLAAFASRIVVTKSTNPRAQEPKVILESLSKVGYKRPSFWAPHLANAIKFAEQVSPGNAVIFISGSIFLIGEARELLKCPKFV